MARRRLLPETDVDTSRIPVGGTYNLRSLRQVAPWLREEVKDELSATAVNENKRQMRIGNDPTAVVVDLQSREIGTGEKQALQTATNTTRFFRGAQRRISFFYTSPAELGDAVKFAWESLERLTRKLTGRAIRTYYAWCEDNGTPGRNSRQATMAGTIAWIEASNSPNINIHLIGPTTEYRRKLIYNPADRRRGRARRRPRKVQAKWAPLKDAWSKGRAIDRYQLAGTSGSKEVLRIRRNRSRSTQALVQVQLGKAIGEIVKQRVRRTFKGVWVGYHFVRSKEGLGHKYGINVPRLYLAPLRTGRRPR